MTLLLADDIDISRGDVIASAANPPELTDELSATLAWLADKPLRPNQKVLVKSGARTVPGRGHRAAHPLRRAEAVH